MRILLAIALLFLAGHSQAQTKPKVGDLAPGFQQVAADGSMLELSSIKGDLILLDFWAGWCKPCLHTIETILNPLYSKYSREQLQIVGVSYDKSADKWEKSMAKFNVPWLHVYDADDYDLYKKYAIEVLPTYYLVDSKGKIVAANVLSADLAKTVDDYFAKGK
ncbi:MAG: TlpA family protein disulfide reductase [Imperialibacter sp.]|uniref:TlpA family protein disulfide reductase n=1 Tax=Imperialibacter sp. TaxID=2038411 RepID=UPI003A899BDF